MLKEAAAKAPQNGFRDKWLISIIYVHALRVSEAIGLSWDQVDFSRANIHINRFKNGNSAATTQNEILFSTPSAIDNSLNARLIPLRPVLAKSLV